MQGMGFFDLIIFYLIKEQNQPKSPPPQCLGQPEKRERECVKSLPKFLRARRRSKSVGAWSNFGARRLSLSLGLKLH